jgi:hypothetical protein
LGSFQFGELNGRDPYDVLKVSRTATAREIKNARRRLQRDGGHTDKGGSDELSKLINVSADLLLDPNRRAEYDRSFPSVSPNDASGGRDDGSGQHAAPRPNPRWYPEEDEGVAGYGPANAPPGSAGWYEPPEPEPPDPREWAWRPSNHQPPSWQQPSDRKTRRPRPWEWNIEPASYPYEVWAIRAMFAQVAVLVVSAVAILSGGRFVAAAAAYSSESPISLFVLLTVMMALPLFGVARRARNVWRTALGPLLVEVWLIIWPLFTIPSRFWEAGPWLLLCIAWWLACAGTLTLLARASNVWPLVARYPQRHRR